jgi:modulator of FtsH protease
LVKASERSREHCVNFAYRPQKGVAFRAMSTFASDFTRERSVSAILGQVMFLVAIALAFCTAGTLIGREMDPETARIFTFVGLGLLIVQWFVPATRVGPLGIFWLNAVGLCIGLGLAPVIAYLSETDPGAVPTAAGITALTTLGMASIGFVLDKDLSGWMKPLSYIVLAAVAVSLISLIFGGLGTLSPLISIVILGVSALLLLVDFNYVRKHATEDDVVWLATGIFISILNIFISLLNIFGGR